MCSLLQSEFVDISFHSPVFRPYTRSEWSGSVWIIWATCPTTCHAWSIVCLWDSAEDLNRIFPSSAMTISVGRLPFNFVNNKCLGRRSIVIRGTGMTYQRRFVSLTHSFMLLTLPPPSHHESPWFVPLEILNCHWLQKIQTTYLLFEDSNFASFQPPIHFVHFLILDNSRSYTADWGEKICIIYCTLRTSIIIRRYQIIRNSTVPLFPPAFLTLSFSHLSEHHTLYTEIPAL